MTTETTRARAEQILEGTWDGCQYAGPRRASILLQEAGVIAPDSRPPLTVHALADLEVGEVVFDRDGTPWIHTMRVGSDRLWQRFTHPEPRFASTDVRDHEELFLEQSPLFMDRPVPAPVAAVSAVTS